jgi:hypothetical protein
LTHLIKIDRFSSRISVSSISSTSNYGVARECAPQGRGGVLCMQPTAEPLEVLIGGVLTL